MSPRPSKILVGSQRSLGSNDLAARCTRTPRPQATSKRRFRCRRSSQGSRSTCAPPAARRQSQETSCTPLSRECRPRRAKRHSKHRASPDRHRRSHASHGSRTFLGCPASCSAAALQAGVLASRACRIPSRCRRPSRTHHPRSKAPRHVHAPGSCSRSPARPRNADPCVIQRACCAC